MARNLKDMVDEIHEQQDGNPDLPSERAGVVRRLNRALQDLCGLDDWYFLYSPSTKLTVYPEVVGSSTETVDITTATYIVTFTGVTVQTYWPGHVFVGPDGLSYEIINISTTGGGNILFLDRPYEGATVTGDDSWKITFATYQLPKDCRNLLTVVNRNQTYSQLVYVSPSLEARYNLRQEIQGTSRVVVDETQILDRAPPKATAATASAGGSLTASTSYEYGYTFLLGGRESPMSPIVAASTTVANKTITITGMQDTRDDTLRTGIFKRLYRRNATLNGRWLKLADEIAESTTSYVDDGTTYVSVQTSNEYLPQEPFRQVVRMWPTPSAELDLDIRYVKRVRDLYADEDVAPIPDHGVSYIIYAALAAIAEQHGEAGAVARYEARAQERLTKLQQSELQRSNVRLQRESSTAFGVTTPLAATPWWGPFYGLQ